MLVAYLNHINCGVRPVIYWFATALICSSKLDMETCMCAVVLASVVVHYDVLFDTW